MRVVDRVHRNAAVVRAPAEPPRAARLADREVLVLEVPDLADRRVAVDEDLARLAGREAHLRVVPFLGHQLRRGAGGADELPAAAPLQLDVVDRRADRDPAERQRVARAGCRPSDRRRSARPPRARPAPGCIASRRPRNGAARCFAVRFGSYSIEATLAGMSVFSRRKSIIRYCRLWPPPMNRDVTRPVLLRPPVRTLGTTRLFSGRSAVISENVIDVWKRRPADVGLNDFTGIESPTRLRRIQWASLPPRGARTPSSSRGAGRRTCPSASTSRPGSRPGRSRP